MFRSSQTTSVQVFHTETGSQSKACLKGKNECFKHLDGYVDLITAEGSGGEDLRILLNPGCTP